LSTIKATTLSNLAGSQTVPVDTVAQGSAKAWVNFNGTGTVAIRRAFNVSSITDRGTGQYTLNFSSAMIDANYSVCATTGGSASGLIARIDPAAIYSTTQVGVNTISTAPADTDSLFVSVAIFS